MCPIHLTSIRALRWWIRKSVQVDSRKVKDPPTAYSHRLKKAISTFYLLHALSVLHCDNKESVWHPYPQSDVINTVSEAAGHKTNVQNSVVHLLIIKERAEEGIRGKIICNIIKWINKISILNIVINLTKEVKNLKALKRKLEKTLEDGKPPLLVGRKN